MIQLLIYDLDGTLVDTIGDVAEAFNSTMVQLGRENLDPGLIQSYFGPGLRRLFETLFPEKNPSEIDELIRIYRGYYCANIAGKSELYPGVLSMLEEMQGRSICQAILTNKFEKGARQLLDQLSLSAYFSSVVGPDTYDSLKPDPKGLQALIKHHLLSPKDAIMIGDSETDIEVAKRAGVRSIAVSYGYRSVTDLERVRPDYLVHSVSELQTLLVRLNEETGSVRPRIPFDGVKG